ncbi:MAG TPA: VWA domain-containing protein [Planctomycetota bacterium]|nr:VWA domain-containing protein [Planctomycetota bacterium]
MLLTALLGLLACPAPSATLPALPRAEFHALEPGDAFDEALARFLKAIRGGSDEERLLRLAELVQRGDVRAAEPLAREHAGVAQLLREARSKARALRYAYDQRQLVHRGLEVRAERDPGAAEELPRQEEALAEMLADVERAEKRAGELEPWVAALADATATLLDAIGPAKRRKVETDLLREAQSPGDLALRLGSIELLGRAGGPGTALELQKLSAETAEAATKLQAGIAKHMGEVRKLEKRMQAESDLAGGRLSEGIQDQYERTKADAAALRTQAIALARVSEAAARAGGAALARESPGDLEKSLPKLLSALKRSKDRPRYRTLQLLSSAPSEAVRAQLRALLAVEAEPLARAEMIDGLAALGDCDLVPLLLERFLQDETWHVRSRAAAALATLRSKEAIPALIARLEVEEGRVRSDVGRALTSLTGKDFHGSVALWKRWWAEKGQEFEVPDALAAPVAAEEELPSTAMSFFGIETESRRVLFVLDLSGSMSFAMLPKSNPEDDPRRPYDMPAKGEPSRLEAAKKDLASALAGLKDGGRFNLVLYASDVWTWSDELVTMTSETRQEVAKAIEGLGASGGTNIYGALERALDIAGAKGGGTWSKPEIDTIYFLTDGRPSIGLTKVPDEILAYVRERNSDAGIVIHTIGLSAAQDAAFLRRLAEENGGQYVAR